MPQSQHMRSHDLVIVNILDSVLNYAKKHPRKLTALATEAGTFYVNFESRKDHLHVTPDAFVIGKGTEAVVVCHKCLTKLRQARTLGTYMRIARSDLRVDWQCRCEEGK